MKKNKKYKTLISSIGIEQMKFSELKVYNGLTTRDADMTILEQSNKITTVKWQ